MIEAGCILFTNWHVKFLCDPNRPVCTFINFGYGPDCQQLKGRRDKNDDVTTIMPELATFMEKCLQKWLKDINIKREKYPHLNFYTMDQLVVLQKELAIVVNESEPSVQVYQLLSLTKEHCSKEDVMKAITLANTCVATLEKKPSNDSRVSYRDKFIQEMEKAGFSMKTACAALNEGIEETDFTSGKL